MAELAFDGEVPVELVPGLAAALAFLALAVLVELVAVLVELLEELPQAASARLTSARTSSAVAGLLGVRWIFGIDIL